MKSLTPASAPASPADTRSQNFLQPVTPQRASRIQNKSLRSPMTPSSVASTPYSPLSLRSLPSSMNTTPASAISTAASKLKRFQFDSPSPTDKNGCGTNNSLADITDNWRTRASEHGIKVGTCEESFFADDEASVSPLRQISPSSQSFEKALLPAPFLSTHRRSRLSQSRSPLSSKPTEQSYSSTTVNIETPPPKSHIARDLKLKGSLTDPPHTRRRPAFGQELFDIDENEFTPYPQSFASPNPLPSHLESQTQFSPAFLTSMHTFALPRIPSPPSNSESHSSENGCSVCGLASGSLAILIPCEHLMCSACLTSALNIVGEKDVECATCKAPVQDFQIQTQSQQLDDKMKPKARQERNESRFFDVLPSRRADVQSSSHEYAVLRVDNVPWDITPPALRVWLAPYPVTRAHVLLDVKGKTLSHAFIELPKNHVRAALRVAQNKILGKGKRARGVTVTVSGQGELMQALFPNWRGGFDGEKPSLVGLDHEQVLSTLEHGLLSTSELESLLRLIRSPDSHFLKVPSLPFHSLMSLLHKFPADLDSRVFWSSALRDKLYETTYVAVQILAARLSEGHGQSSSTYGPDLFTQLINAGLSCRAFTAQQLAKLSHLIDSRSSPSPSAPSSITGPSPRTPDTLMPPHLLPHTGAMFSTPQDAGSPFSVLAREFGVEPHVVHALAQRLTGLY